MDQAVTVVDKVDTPPAPEGLSELGRRAWKLYYETLRTVVETEKNIGKIIVIEVESGDYEIDEEGIESSRRLQARHPEATLYAMRIGYDAVEVFGGFLDRTVPYSLSQERVPIAELEQYLEERLRG